MLNETSANFFFIPDFLLLIFLKYLRSFVQFFSTFVLSSCVYTIHMIYLRYPSLIFNLMSSNSFILVIQYFFLFLRIFSNLNLFGVILIYYEEIHLKPLISILFLKIFTISFLLHVWIEIFENFSRVLFRKLS